MSESGFDVEIGQEATFKRAYLQSDFDRFAALSGDDNPIHVDPEFAAGTRFGRTVCHGMLLYGGIARVIGERLLGPGSVLLASDLMFPTPAYADEELEYRLTVDKTHQDTGAITVGAIVSRPNGEWACQGKVIAGRSADLLSQIERQGPGTKGESASELKGMRLGQEAAAVRIFTIFELAEYVELVGDRNPLHCNVEIAGEQGLDGLMIPGALIGGLFSDLLGTKLPGRGTNWLKQRINYLSPVYPGQILNPKVVITRLRPEKDLVNLSTTCLNPAGETICTGEVLVLVRDLQAG